MIKQVNVIIKLVIISLVFSLSSCSKDDNEPTINGNYYVKYVIKGNGAYSRFSNWNVTTPEGEYTNNGTQVRSWEQTYGPVSKGFKCEVKVNSYISGAPTIEILVSKNNEPFSLKASQTGNNASYIIDF